MSSEAPTTARDVLAMDGTHTQPWTTCAECARLVRKYQAEGYDRMTAIGGAETDHIGALGSKT